MSNPLRAYKILSVVLVSIIVIILLMLCVLVQNFNSPDSLMGAWDLDGDFAESAGLTEGLLILRKKEKLITGYIYFMDGEEVKVSELFTLHPKFTFSPANIWKKQLSFMANIEYINKKSITLPDDAKFHYDMMKGTLSITNDDKIFGLFTYNDKLAVQDDVGDV